MEAHQKPFSKIPTELVTEIFSLLPTLHDIFALAATCHRINHIWSTNATGIYHRVAPRSIPCEPYARRFLSDSGGPAPDYPKLNTVNIRHIARNASIVEKSIAQFEKDIVWRVRSESPQSLLDYFSWINEIASGIPKAEREACYGEGARRHPPYLTSKERPRFVRLYYQIWGLMKLNADQQQSRLQSMSLKQLYRLHEMSRLPQNVGGDEARSPDTWPNAPPETAHLYFNWSQSKVRSDLMQRIREHLEERYQSAHKCGADSPEVYAKEEGYYPFIVIWDHWKPSLKLEVCNGKRRSDDGTRLVYRNEDLWEETSDEDA